VHGYWYITTLSQSVSDGSARHGFECDNDHVGQLVVNCQEQFTFTTTTCPKTVVIHSLSVILY